MANKTTFETINIDDFNHDPINQKKVQSYPPELVGRFNSFIVTAFDDSMTVEMQIRTLIKWIKENIDVTTSALDNMEAFKQDSMAFQNHVKNTLVNLINQFTDKFDDNLKAETLEILNQWFVDGVLSDLVRDAINEEVFDARGGKDSLGERLDESDNKLSNINNEVINARGDKATLGQRLDDIAHSMGELKGDGITDDSLAIQTIFNKARDLKVKKITFPKSVYRIDSPMFIWGDDIEIDFSGSEIHSHANAVNGVKGELGIFNFHGEIEGGDVVSFIRNQVLPTGATMLLSYESVLRTSTIDFFKGGRIVTSNNNLYSIGDEIYVRSYGHAGGNYNSDLYQTEIAVVAKVVGKNENYLYIDYYSPFEYPTIMRAYVLKVNMLKNVKISNLKIIDKTSVETANGIPTANDRLKALSAINPILVDGFELNNVEVVNHRGNAVFPRFSRNLKLVNISAKNAQLWDGGLGYLVQFLACRDIEVINAYGDGCRHVVDLSYSNNAKITNAHGINHHSACLDLHGICEHDVEWINCSGFLTMGNSPTMFPNIVKNIKFKDCELSLKRVSNQVYDSFVDNVHFENCKINMDAFFWYTNVLVENCEVEWEFYATNRKINRRGLDMDTSCVIKDTKINLIPKNDNEYSYISDYDYLNLKNVEFDRSMIGTTRGIRMTLTNIGELIFDGVKQDGFKIVYRNSRGKASLDIVNSRYKYKDAEDYFLNLDIMEDTHLIMNIRDNDVIHEGVSSQFFAVDARDENMVNSLITGKIKDNNFLGNSSAKIHYIYNTVNDPSKADIHIFDYNNTIKHIDTTPSVKWDLTKNNIID